jgi:LysM repeat protein
MSIACQYDQLKYPIFLEDMSGQILVEAKLQISESLPKIGRIISGDFKIGPVAYTVNDDLIMVSGKVYPQLLFVAELPDQRYHQEEDRDDEQETAVVDLPQEYGADWLGEDGINYEGRIKIPGLRPEMLVQVEVIPIKGIFEKDSPDLVIFQGSIQVTVWAAYHKTEGIISDISVQAPDQINLVKDVVMVEELIDTKKVTLPIRSTLMLPNLKPGVARILKVLASPTGLSQEMARGRLLVRGAIDVAIVYVGSDDEGIPTEIFAHNWSQDTGSAIPFETHMDFDDADGQIVALPRVTARDISIESQVPHELTCLMNLDFEVTLSKLWQKELVVDTTPGDGEVIDNQKDLLNIEEYIGETSGEVNLEQQIELPGHLARMERILVCYGTPREVTVEAAEGKVLIEGGLELGVMYISEGVIERKLHLATWDKNTENELTLAGILEFPGLQPGTMLRTRLMVDSLKAEMIDDRRLKLSGVIKVRVLARTPRALFVIRDCAIVVPVEPSSRPSMLFYVVQAEDTLWKIARRYQTTVDTLVKANRITGPDNIEVGQKLLIPKKVINL